LKNKKNYVGGLCIKMLDEIKENMPPKNIKCTQKGVDFLA
jgi:hypothetical protein